MKPILMMGAALVALLPTVTLADSHSDAPKLSVVGPYSYHPIPGVPAGGYMELTTQNYDDRLIAASSPRAEMVMIHKTEVDADGIASMMHIDAVDLPAGETIEFKSGGLHLMIMGLKGAAKPGDRLPLTLVFETAGEVQADLKIFERGTDIKPMDTSKMMISDPVIGSDQDENVVEKAKGMAGHAMELVTDKTAEAVDGAKSMTGDVVEGVKTKAEDMKAATGELVEGAKTATGDMVDGAKAIAGDAVETVTETTANVVEGAKAATESAVEATETKGKGLFGRIKSAVTGKD